MAKGVRTSVELADSVKVPCCHCTMAPGQAGLTAVRCVKARNPREMVT